MFVANRRRAPSFYIATVVAVWIASVGCVAGRHGVAPTHADFAETCEACNDASVFAKVQGLVAMGEATPMIRAGILAARGHPGLWNKIQQSPLTQAMVHYIKESDVAALAHFGAPSGGFLRRISGYEHGGSSLRPHESTATTEALVSLLETEAKVWMGGSSDSSTTSQQTASEISSSGSSVDGSERTGGSLFDGWSDSSSTSSTYSGLSSVPTGSSGFEQNAEGPGGSSVPSASLQSVVPDSSLQETERSSGSSGSSVAESKAHEGIENLRGIDPRVCVAMSAAATLSVLMTVFFTKEMTKFESPVESEVSHHNMGKSAFTSALSSFDVYAGNLGIRYGKTTGAEGQMSDDASFHSSLSDLSQTSSSSSLQPSADSSTAQQHGSLTSLLSSSSAPSLAQPLSASSK